MNFKPFNRFIKSKILPIPQGENSECGLACLLMVANYFGHDLDMTAARHTFQPTLRGTSFPQMVSMASQLGLSAKVLRAELSGIRRVRLPAVIHWQFNHYVVLESFEGSKSTIIDPSKGRRTISETEFSDSFTGIVIEFSPKTDFLPQKHRASLPISELFDRKLGLLKSGLLVAPIIILLEASSLLLPQLFRKIVDYSSGSAPNALYITLAFSILLALSVGGLTALRSAALIRITSRSIGPQSLRMFRHLLSLPYHFFEARHASDIISRFGSLQAAHRLLTIRTIDAALDGALCLAMIAILWKYQPVAATGVFSAILLAAGLHLLFADRMRTLSGNAMRLEANQQTELIECVRGIQTLKVANLQWARSIRFQTAAHEYLNARSREQWASQCLVATQRALFGVAMVMVMLSLSLFAGAGGLGAGTSLMIIAYASHALFRGERAIGSLNDFHLLSAHAKRLSDIALSKPEDSGAPLVLSAEDSDKALGIEFRDIWFRFGPHEPWLLKGISFVVPAKSSVAIVGPSGCGKTTLLKLMLGLLEPERGEIVVDGSPLKIFGKQRLRAVASSVMQDDRLFSGSIYENITSFETPPHIEAAVMAARAALIDEEISTMPMKYHTIINGGASGFSGGQRQRLLIARALYRKPRILIMDEATSHLDAKREQVISQHIAALGVTRILVAHRQETIATADIVIHLQSAGIA
nr:peptidase domain-containing ABC transporter [uncultured Roseateles sp.]